MEPPRTPRAPSPDSATANRRRVALLVPTVAKRHESDESKGLSPADSGGADSRATRPSTDTRIHAHVKCGQSTGQRPPSRSFGECSFDTARDLQRDCSGWLGFDCTSERHASSSSEATTHRQLSDSGTSSRVQDSPTSYGSRTESDRIGGPRPFSPVSYMSSGNQTPKSRNSSILNSLFDVSEPTLPHPLDCLVNCLANRPGDNSGDSSPDHAADSLENRLDDYPADNLEDNLPESLADSLDNFLENHLDNYSADCPENHLEDNSEDNLEDNLPDYSADCPVNCLPDYLENYLGNYGPSAVFSSLSAARITAPRY